MADALRALAPGQRGPEIAVDGLGGTVDGEPFYAIVPLALVEVTGEAGEQVFRGLGLHTERVQPAPAGVLARIVCQVINESAFALGEGVGSVDDIDTGMMLGLSHPRGPFAWMREIGPGAGAQDARRAGRGVPRGALPPRAGVATPRGRSRLSARCVAPCATNSGSGVGGRRRRRPLGLGQISERASPRAWAPRACRADTTRRRAPPDSLNRPR